MRLATLTTLAGLACAACVSPPAPTTLQGVAAAAGPLVHARITVRDHLGTERTTTADAQGHYQLDISALQAPLAVMATQANTDPALCNQSRAPRPACMVALIDTLTPTETRANVNPLTDWVASDVALQLGLRGPHQLALALPPDVPHDAFRQALGQLRAGFGDALVHAEVAHVEDFDPAKADLASSGQGLQAVLMLLNHNRGYDNNTGESGATVITDVLWNPIAKPFGPGANEPLQWARSQAELARIRTAPRRVFIVGDSTAATYERQRMPRMGWGQVFEAEFAHDSGIKVVNGARAGRSSRDFFNGGWYAQMARFIQAGDYVLIAHGHNDQNCNALRALRGSADVANLCTYPNTPQGHMQFPPGQPQMSFQQALTVYVQDARSRGATPVLMTPTVRFLNADRKTAYQGADTRPVVSTHFIRQPLTGGYAFVGDYVQTIRDTAAAQRVPLMDLEAKTIALANAHPNDWTDYWLEAADTTHFQERGARAIAALVAQGLRETPQLAPLAQGLK